MSRGDFGHLRCRLIEGDSRSQPGDHPHPGLIAGARREVGADRPPGVDVSGYPGVGGHHQAELRGQDTHHLKRPAVRPQALAEDRGITAETALPEAVTEDQRCGRDLHIRAIESSGGEGRAVLGRERASPGWPNAQYFEEIAGDAGDLDLLRWPVAGQRHLVDGVGGGESFEQARLLAVVDEVWWRHRRAFDRRGLHAVPQQDQPFGLGVGQWPQQHRFDHREDRHIGTDRERQRHDRRHGEPGRTYQTSAGAPKILPEVAHGMPPCGKPAHIPGASWRAEAPPTW